MTKEEDDMRVALLENELKASLEKNHTLERDNEQLKQELACLQSQMAVIKSQNADRRSNLWKNLGTITSTDNNASQHKHIKQNNGSATEIPAVEDSSQKTDYPDVTDRKDRAPRIPKPPPKPTSNSVTPMLVSNEKASRPPPPPPLKLKRDSASAVIRVQEVVELYRTLTRRDAKLDMKSGNQADLLPINGREMIGEIENRSAYLLAIKSDVETQGEFIRFLMKEVQNAAYKEIADVEAFVKWLDNELSYLVDERAVLKHFPEWPERKADAMREAAFGYRDLKNLESEVLSFRDDPQQPTPFALKRIQALQDK
ncbi:hypothetical protein QJS10_CPB21g01320 [Acorus calamus]|uniref:CHUP1 n=1 Tax=Acorus calamus TaxID=4465 RepID=A0AAV9C2Z7_ACOCL|nr:hypothetical protein QJS10_CPB21g01320 [Acorus calamus]